MHGACPHAIQRAWTCASSRRTSEFSGFFRGQSRIECELTWQALMCCMLLTIVYVVDYPFLCSIRSAKRYRGAAVHFFLAFEHMYSLILSVAGLIASWHAGRMVKWYYETTNVYPVRTAFSFPIYSVVVRINQHHIFCSKRLPRFTNYRNFRSACEVSSYQDPLSGDDLFGTPQLLPWPACEIRN